MQRAEAAYLSWGKQAAVFPAESQSASQGACFLRKACEMPVPSPSTSLRVEVPFPPLWRVDGSLPGAGVLELHTTGLQILLRLQRIH